MDIDYSLIGQRISALRKARGLKQWEVCEKAEINDKYLSIIERARSIPSLEVLMRICEALDVTPDSILVGTQRGDSKKDGEQLAQRIAALTKEQQETISDLVSCMEQRNLRK